MAEIPVEKKSSMAWLWWLLLILGILALIWWLIAANDDDEVETDLDNGMAVEGDAEYDDTAVTDDGDMMADGETAAISGVAGLASLGDMVGRNVELSDVAVNRVVGDEAFTVGEGENETLVMFDEERTPNTPMEGGVDVNPGSNVTINGEVQAYNASDVPTSVSEEIADGVRSMIFATSVETAD